MTRKKCHPSSSRRRSLQRVSGDGAAADISNTHHPATGEREGAESAGSAERRPAFNMILTAGVLSEVFFHVLSF